MRHPFRIVLVAVFVLFVFPAVHFGQQPIAPDASSDKVPEKKEKQGAHKGTLDFVIAPSEEGEDSLDKSLVEKCIRDLRKNGPRAVQDTSYRWYLLVSGPGLHSSCIMVRELGKGQKWYILLPEESKEKWKVVNAKAVEDHTGLPAVDVTLDKVSGKRLKKLTSANVTRRLAIIVDGRVLSAPIIVRGIAKRFLISGCSSREECEKMAREISGRRPQE